MPLVPLQLPAGVYANGTDLQAQGRWHNASLVRWTDGTMRPVGGWSKRKETSLSGPRGAIAWSDLSGDRRLAFGSYNKLVTLSAAGTLTDITPTSLVVGLNTATILTGYGGSYYGTEAYNEPRPDNGAYSEATTWSMDTFGEYLVACSSADKRILEWTLNVANKAVAVTNAPTGNRGVMVTEERFLVALGAGGNPRKVQWSDREDRNTWTAAATNEAGDIELQTQGHIMQGLRGRGQAVILTDQDAHTMTYIGPPFVYSFQRVGQSCGNISRKSAVAVDAGIFWMGRSGFYRFSGGAVQEVPCDVADYVFSNINYAQASKIWGVSNAKYGEVWWFYCSGDSSAINRYVCYNYRENHWSIGNLWRNCGVDGGIFDTPIWLDGDGVAWNHESGFNHRGEAVFAESGPIQMGQGDQVLSAVELLPDEKTQGDVQLLFKTRFYPNGTQYSHGPYSMANPTGVRFTGRQFSVRVDDNKNADWRLGVPRLNVLAGGQR